MDELLKQLQDKRNKLAGELKALAARQDKWTAEDRAAWEAKNTEYDTAVGEIKARKEKLDEEEAERQKLADRIRIIDAHRDEPATARPNFGRDNGRNTDDPQNVRRDAEGRVVGFFDQTDETVTMDFNPRRGGLPLNYRQQKRENLRQLKAAGYKPWGEFKDFRDFVRSGFDGHEQGHFRDRYRKHYNAVAGMSESVGSDGGFTVMPEFASGIIDRVYDNNLWSLTDNYPVTGNNMTFLANAETSRATGSRHGGMRGYWLAEGASATGSKPTLRQVSMKLVKCGVLVYLTEELMQDTGFALQQYVTSKAAQEFKFIMGDSLINGTGVGQPLGALNFPSLVSVAKETGQAGATIVPENVVKMYARFYAPGLQNATWFHNQDIGPQLDLMTLGIGAAGIAVYLPPGNLSAAPYGTLRGRPMQPTEFNATLGTQGDMILADMGQILSISKGGVMQSVSMHVQFLTQQTALLFTMRLNAGPWEAAAITPYKGSSNTQSNFIALDTRA